MIRVQARHAPAIAGGLTGAAIGLLLLVAAPELRRFDTNYLIPTYWKLVVAASMIASGAGAFVLGRGWLRWSAALAAGVVLAYVIRVAIDVDRDRTTHNLLPLEIVFDYLVTFVGAAVGALIGWNARRLADKPTEQGPYAPGWKKPR